MDWIDYKWVPTWKPENGQACVPDNLCSKTGSCPSLAVQLHEDCMFDKIIEIVRERVGR